MKIIKTAKRDKSHQKKYLKKYIKHLLQPRSKYRYPKMVRDQHVENHCLKKVLSVFQALSTEDNLRRLEYLFRGLHCFNYNFNQF